MVPLILEENENDFRIAIKKLSLGIFGTLLSARGLRNTKGAKLTAKTITDFTSC